MAGRNHDGGGDGKSYRLREAEDAAVKKENAKTKPKK